MSAEVSAVSADHEGSLKKLPLHVQTPLRELDERMAAYKAKENGVRPADIFLGARSAVLALQIAAVWLVVTPGQLHLAVAETRARLLEAIALTTGASITEGPMAYERIWAELDKFETAMSVFAARHPAAQIQQ